MKTSFTFYSQKQDSNNFQFVNQVIKTTETSLGQNIINGTADQEDESTTTTLADTAEDIGTNVRIVIYIYLYVLEMICVSELSL